MNDIRWPYTDRRGRVRLVIWRNENDDGTCYYNTEVYRRYNAATGDSSPEWKTTHKMDDQDLPDGLRLLDIADKLIAEAKGRDGTARPSEVE